MLGQKGRLVWVVGPGPMFAAAQYLVLIRYTREYQLHPPTVALEFGVESLCSVTTTGTVRRVLGKIFVVVLPCHSNDVDVFSLMLHCAFGGCPLHLPIRLYLYNRTGSVAVFTTSPLWQCFLLGQGSLAGLGAVHAQYAFNGCSLLLGCSTAALCS